ARRLHHERPGRRREDHRRLGDRVLADADGPDGSRGRRAGVDPGRPRHGDHGEHRARLGLAGVRRARAQALLRLGPSGVTGLEEAFERIGAATEELLPRTHAPGLALAVTDREATLGAVVRGFADVAAGRAIGPDTRFQIGSISKSFAALCVLQEAAKGALALDISVNELLPWVDLPEPFGPITLHHLLTHTSGLMTGVEHGPWGIIDAIRAREFPPTFAPGERYSYSNLGYKLVGHVLE